MKVLHVVPTYFPAIRYGGPIVSVHGLCRALVARGIDVEVFTTNVDGDRTLDVPVGEQVRMDGVAIRYFSSPFRRVYWSPAMRSQLVERAESFDVIHSHAVFLWPGIAAGRAARDAGVPHVISPRGMLVPELIRAKSPAVKSLWLRAFEARRFGRASAVHLTSEIELRDARRVGLPLPSPFVVPNGVELPLRPDVSRRDDTLVFLGRLTWKKGIERVIELLPSLPGVRFIVAGNDEESLTPRLQALASSLDVANRVEFRGPVYGSVKDELLASAALFVLPSQSENFGNVVVEALAMETPVVVSAEVGVAGDVVKSGAGITDLTGIATLLGDSSRRATMGRKGRALAEERFAWPRVAEEMECAYARLMRGIS